MKLKISSMQCFRLDGTVKTGWTHSKQPWKVWYPGLRHLIYIRMHLGMRCVHWLRTSSVDSGRLFLIFRSQKAVLSLISGYFPGSLTVSWEITAGGDGESVGAVNGVQRAICLWLWVLVLCRRL